MGTERMSLDSKHTYSSVTKGNLSFGGGGDSREEAIGAGIDSYFSIYGGVVLKLSGSNNMFTFLVYPSTLKLSIPKGSQQVCPGS